MHIDSMFPSTYLKASDLQGRNILVKIDRISQEMVGQGSQQEHKWVVYFVGKEKGVILNKTNGANIAAAYGGDTDDWVGKEIVLFPAMVDFQGRTVEAIRMRQPRAADRPRTNSNGQQAGIAPQQPSRHLNRTADAMADNPPPRQQNVAPAGYDDQIPPDDEIPF